MLRIYFLEPPSPQLEFLDFLLYPWKFQTKQGFTPRNSTKLCYTPWKIQGLNLRPLENSHDFFSITPGNSMSFIINTWKICLLFLQYPWKFHILNPFPPPLFVFFFWNSSIQGATKVHNSLIVIQNSKGDSKGNSRVTWTKLKKLHLSFKFTNSSNVW